MPISKKERRKIQNELLKLRWAAIELTARNNIFNKYEAISPAAKSKYGMVTGVLGKATDGMLASLKKLSKDLEVLSESESKLTPGNYQGLLESLHAGLQTASDDLEKLQKSSGDLKKAAPGDLLVEENIPAIKEAREFVKHERYPEFVESVEQYEFVKLLTGLSKLSAYESANIVRKKMDVIKLSQEEEKKELEEEIKKLEVDVMKKYEKEKLVLEIIAYKDIANRGIVKNRSSVGSPKNKTSLLKEEVDIDFLIQLYEEVKTAKTDRLTKARSTPDLSSKLYEKMQKEKAIDDKRKVVFDKLNKMNISDVIAKRKELKKLAEAVNNFESALGKIKIIPTERRNQGSLARLFSSGNTKEEDAAIKDYREKLPEYKEALKDAFRGVAVLKTKVDQDKNDPSKSAPSKSAQELWLESDREYREFAKQKTPHYLSVTERKHAAADGQPARAPVVKAPEPAALAVPLVNDQEFIDLLKKIIDVSTTILKILETLQPEYTAAVRFVAALPAANKTPETPEPSATPSAQRSPSFNSKQS